MKKIKSKGILESKDFDNGLWQFIMDHTYSPDGKIFTCKFNFETEEEVINRVYARITGVYKVKDEKKIEMERSRKEAKIIKLRGLQKAQSARDIKFKKLSPFKQFIVKKLQKTSSRLLNKWSK